MAYSSAAFREKYDELQGQLHALAARDDLLTGKIHDASILNTNSLMHAIENHTFNRYQLAWNESPNFSTT